MTCLKAIALRMFVALTLALLLSGCSWMTHFIVTNASDAPIKLFISTEKRDKELGDTICPIDYWSYLETNIVPAGSSVSWQRLPQERYKLDQQSCSADIEVLSGESVSITQQLNYFESEHAKDLLPEKINKLVVQSKDGEISITGVQIAKHFRRIDKVTYMYTIN